MLGITRCARWLMAGGAASLLAHCNSNGSSSGLMEYGTAQQGLQALVVHAQPGSMFKQWKFDPPRGRFILAADTAGSAKLKYLLEPKKGEDGSVTGISSLYPLTVVELSAATLGEAVQEHSDVSPIISIAECPSFVPDGSFDLTRQASRMKLRNAVFGSRVSQHYTWLAHNGSWSIHSAHCLRDQPIAWQDSAAIRANLRQFTSDEAWLDVLVNRMQSLQRHGVRTLQGPKLAAWQIDAFLNNPKYVPSAEIRKAFETIFPQIQVHGWESFVSHLSAAWQQFLRTVDSDDRVVILRRLRLQDPTYTGTQLSRTAEIKSDDWVYELIRDWTESGFLVFDYFSNQQWQGQWDGDTLFSLNTLRKWASDPAFVGKVRFVYLDDWILSGNLVVGALSHAEKFAEITEAFQIDVVTAFQSDNPHELNDYVKRWPYHSKLAIHREPGLSTHVIPTLGSATNATDRAALFIDWMTPFSLGAIPYHRGDMFNNVYFWLDGSGAIHYSESPVQGAKKVLLFDLLGVTVAPVPYG